MVCMRTDKANRLSILFACFCKENRIYSKMRSYNNSVIFTVLYLRTTAFVVSDEETKKYR